VLAQRPPAPSSTGSCVELLQGRLGIQDPTPVFDNQCFKELGTFEVNCEWEPVTYALCGHPVVGSAGGQEARRCVTQAQVGSSIQYGAVHDAHALCATVPAVRVDQERLCTMVAPLTWWVVCGACTTATVPVQG
jgi:hypothetical protein